jgi:tetratricopeptide (TPR) repeat protein
MTKQRRATAGSTILLAAAAVAAVAVLRLGPSPAFAQEKTEKSEKSENNGKKGKAEKEPFYRKYLVPGATLDDRIREQEKKVAENPNSADLRNDFGNLLAARRFPHEAREQYEAAIKLDKTGWMAPYNLGLLEESEGHTGPAISAYEKSIDRNRGFPPSRWRLARLYERTGRNASAIHEYARALEIDPEMREVRHNPLAAESRLLDRVSLANYEKDTAKAAVRGEVAWADSKFMHAPVDRAVWSNEFVDPSEPEPVEATVSSPSTAPRNPQPLPPRPGETRPQDLGTRPAAPPPPPAMQSLQPTAAPVPATDPDNPLMLRPRPPLPTPLPQ